MVQLPPPLDLPRDSELVHAPLVLEAPPSPPPPEPHPNAATAQVPQMPVPTMAEEALIEDPHPTRAEQLPPIAWAAAMHEHIGDQIGVASIEPLVAQRFMPIEIGSPEGLEPAGITGLWHLAPEQFVMEQHHLLMPDPFQASPVDFLDIEAMESATAAIGQESGVSMHLAATEQRPSVVGAAQQSRVETPLISELERMPDAEEFEEFRLTEAEQREAEQSSFDIDLGAFELVDSGITAEELLTNEDPVIYHKDLPVHSVHHDTVQTEAAIENLMNAPPSMLSTQVPPTMVADNYCFAVDADRIQMGDILGDEHWWKHTSRPTKYFFSNDLHRFYRVQCLAVRGRIVSARLANTTPAMGGGSPSATELMVGAEAGSASYPGESFSIPAFRRSITGPGRTSFASAAPTSVSGDSAPSTSAGLSVLPATLSGHTPRGSFANFALQQQQQHQQYQQALLAQWRQHPGAQRGELVELADVYRVVRFYSFWRTCTSFHRIVTMIERVGQPTTSSVQRSASQTHLNRGVAEQPAQPPLPHTSASSAASESSSSARGGHRPPPDFQKRVFVQYLWRNAKPSDKARVQREFDPRRQRLLKYVQDTAARKRMTSAKAQWRSESAGTSTDKQPRWSHLTPPGSATMPFSASSPSVRWRLPAISSASAGAPSSPIRRSSPGAHSSATTPILLRRAQTSGAIEGGREGGGGKRAKRKS